MKHYSLTCDRCHQPIRESDDMVRDFLESQYPGKDICQNCDSIIQMQTEAARRDAIDTSPPGTSLMNLAKVYDIPIKQRGKKSIDQI